MKKMCILLFSVLFLEGGLSAQSVSPSKDASIWYLNGSLQVQDKASSFQQPFSFKETESDTLSLLNFHSVTHFREGDTSMQLPYDISHSSRLTVIVVFHSQDTLSEHGIWSVFRDEKQITGFTDKRLLRQNSEYIYPVKRRGIPLINTSMQAFSKIRAKANRNYFALGEALLPHSSTLSSFSGNIAECLVFDHFLKRQEALKIETYLAIKYGITLIESDYLSPFDVVLWDYEANKTYSNGIAGLGRDSVFGLEQKQGCSSEEADLLTIGVGNFSVMNKDNTYSLIEGNYLLWGHNDAALAYSNASCESSYPLMDRKWLIQMTYTQKTKPFPTMVKFRLPQQNQDSSRIYYLVIDRSGSGDFSSKKVEYIVQNRVDSEGYVYFDNVLWDTDGSGKDLFTFSYSTVRTETQPSCPNASTGSLTIAICGGQTPFSYLLERDSINQQFTYQGGRNYMFEGLAGGYYTLLIRDGYNNNLSQKILVTIDSATCDFLSKTDTVLKKHKDNFDENRIETVPNELLSSYYTVYPNPTKGQYKVVANLPQTTPIALRLYSMNGSLMKEWKDTEKKQYTFDGYIHEKGSYAIEIETDFGVKVFKLVVVK